MSSFTCPSPTTALDDTTAMAPFPAPNGYTSVIPNTFIPSSDRNPTSSSYSPLSQAYIQNRVNNILIPSNGLEAPDVATGSTDAGTRYTEYEVRLNSFLAIARNEYCHYYNCYKYWLSSAVEKTIQNTSGNSNQQQSATPELTKAAELNTRLIDFTMILNFITNKMAQRTGVLAAQTNDLNTDIRNNFTQLRAQAQVLKDQAPAAELKRRMVEFTKEKSKATNNLLSLYFFLDIVALGMLFYVYKASSA